ncbi:hypothetical protein TR2A62_1079 [Thalassobium sp. R2A62]|jgi:hypothetical protein|nr:hypothetical protein TR2A62_1079 [Thalassobium sp. R2A62]
MAMWRHLHNKKYKFKRWTIIDQMDCRVFWAGEVIPDLHQTTALSLRF